MAAPMSKVINTIITSSLSHLRRHDLVLKCLSCRFSDAAVVFRSYNVVISSLRFSRRRAGNSWRNKTILYGALSLSFFGFGKREKVNEFNLLVAKARIAEQQLQFTECDKLYHEALSELEKQFKDNKMTELEFIEKQTVVFDALGNIYLLQGKVRQGEQLMKATLQGLLACGREESDNAILEISLKLANIFALQKREAEAIAGYRFCYRILNQKIDEGQSDSDTLALLGLTCDNYGRYLLSLQDYIQAEHYFLKALEVSRNLNGESHPQSLLIMNNLATLGAARKDYSKSCEHLENAVKFAKNSQEQDMNILAAVYCNLAMVYHHQGMKLESFLALKEAETLAKMTTNDELAKEIDECKKKIDP